LDHQAFTIAVSYLAAFAGWAFFVVVAFHPVRTKLYWSVGFGLSMTSLMFLIGALSFEGRLLYGTAPRALQLLMLGAVLQLMLVSYLVSGVVAHRRPSPLAPVFEWVYVATFALFISGLITVGGVVIVTDAQFLSLCQIVFSSLLFVYSMGRLFLHNGGAMRPADHAGLLVSQVRNPAQYQRRLVREGWFSRLSVMSDFDLKVWGLSKASNGLKPHQLLTVQDVEKRWRGSIGQETERELYQSLLEVMKIKNVWAVMRMPGRNALLLATPRPLGSIKAFEAQVQAVAQGLTALFVEGVSLEPLGEGQESAISNSTDFTDSAEPSLSTRSVKPALSIVRANQLDA
jgi:hypothetical protein